MGTERKISGAKRLHLVQPQADSLPSQTVEDGGKSAMLWTIFVILLVLWLLGWIGFHTIGWYIHLLLVLALIVLVIQLVTGRRPVV